jgi:hypothetical protein
MAPSDWAVVGEVVMKLRASLFAGSALLSATLLVASIGCATPQQTRMQAQDEPPEEERYELKVVADVSDAISNAEPLPIAGVGLVTGLSGTGSAARPSGWRSYVEQALQRKNVKNVKAILQDTNNSIVLVSGLIPSGAHKGDSFDVEITLPPGSETTSLSGGYLEECVLVDYQTIAGLGLATSGDHRSGGLGRAKASGRLLIELGDGGATETVAMDDMSDVGRHDKAAPGTVAARKARIWNGGRSLLERPFVLAMNEKNRQYRIVAQAADRINDRFHGPLGSSSNSNIAATSGDQVTVMIGVPPQYKLNQERYLRVVRLIPLHERRKSEKDADPKKTPNLAETMAHYKQQLEQDLLDPGHTVTAALRLEALGVDSVGALKHGLTSEHVLVRFCSAEALAYLDCRAGVPELARVIVEQPSLRAYALTAMASIDEGISVAYLQDLLANSDPEVRYGAFRALRSLDEKSYTGDVFNQGYSLHHVPCGTTPLVHVSTSRRAEIVLFGDEPSLSADFSILAGNFVLASAPGDTRCTISHYVGGTNDRRQCSLKLDDVVHTMGHMNAQYGEVLQFLAQAYKIKSLPCDLRFDAMPQAPQVEELAKAGLDAKHRAELARQGKVPEIQDRTDEELFNARTQLPGTPGLFQRGGAFTPKLSADLKDDEASLDSHPQHR